MKHTMILLLGLMATAEAVVVAHSDSLRDYARDLRDESLDDTDVMQVATVQERADFAAMAAHLQTGNLNAADALAGVHGYQVVNFTDSDTGKVYYHLREGAIGVDATKGWGSYFYSASGTKNVLIQAPHIRHDTHSYDVAAVALANSGATAMMFNGAHRDAGGNNVADVAHLSSSIFQTVHEVWSSGNTNQAWQIHGFDLDNHPNIPAGTDVVLSNGDGSVSDEIKNLGIELEAVSYINDSGSIAHAYNTLNVNDPDNVAVNGNVSGSLMSTLGATTNEQGIYTRAQGGTFVHIELEKSIRLDGTLAEDLANRKTAGLAIANAVQSVPEPSTLWMLGLGVLTTVFRRRRPFAK